jgi:hypothetical protein
MRRPAGELQPESFTNVRVQPGQRVLAHSDLAGTWRSPSHDRGLQGAAVAGVERDRLHVGTAETQGHAGVSGRPRCDLSIAGHHRQGGRNSRARIAGFDRLHKNIP